MKHTKHNCRANDLIIACKCGLSCSNCGACSCVEKSGSLLSAIKENDLLKQADWMKRAEAGEVMRIM